MSCDDCVHYSGHPVSPYDSSLGYCLKKKTYVDYYFAMTDRYCPFWSAFGAEQKENVPDQNAKADVGKPKLTRVPRAIIYDICKVKEYGDVKYGDTNNWKTVEPERYKDAAFRHFMAYLDDPDGVDEESGLPHLSHLACNIAFLCEFRRMKEK